ncbi:MAG: hypothetical protein WKF42_05935 [Solirubrobacteraceae bacterium]
MTPLPLLKDRDAPSEVAPAPLGGGAPVTVPDFACTACGGGMKPGQDWCLECGSAAPGRLGARPGWRAAFTVVGVTLLLVMGAVLAGYAALTSDAQRTASAPSRGSGEPIAAAAAPATPAPAPAPAAVDPGATGPNTTPPVISPPAPAGKTIIPITPPAAVTNTQIKPPAAAPPPAATFDEDPATPPSAGDKQKAESAAAPETEVVKFKKGAAATYDPGARAGAEFGPAENAIDKSAKTVWDVVVPADGKPIGTGLMIDLGRPYALRALQIATPTKGFGVEVYAAQSAKETPEDILDKRWEHLTDVKSVIDGKLISLRNKSKEKHQLLLLYVTMPAEPTDPRVAIGDVTVAGTT